jgi:hypothetical protein
MWTRALLKSNAKASLRTNYWRVFAICLAAGLLTGGFRSGRSSLSAHYSVQNGFQFLPNTPLYMLWALSARSALGVGLVALLLGLIWVVFVAPVLEVGRCRAMMENRVGKPPFETLFAGFGPQYKNLVKGRFYANLRICLYTLLLVIPGIIKSYEYFFVPYLLAENPGLSPARAAELSRRMTDGEKWNMFVLQLSFLGWFILGALTFGIGRFFVEPYYQATMAELYAAMRAKAFALGYTDAQELGDFVRY